MDETDDVSPDDGTSSSFLGSRDFTFLCSELHISSNWILDCMLANLGYKLLWLISRNFDESFVAYHLFVIMFVLCCVLTCEM
jgi:hypothetical protein